MAIIQRATIYSVLKRIKKPKQSRWSPRLAVSLLSAISVLWQRALSEQVVRIDGIGLVPAKIVLACEQATGDGGHEAFFDAEWDYFSDCVNDELYRRRKN